MYVMYFNMFTFLHYFVSSYQTYGVSVYPIVCMYGSTHDDMVIRKIDIFLFSIISLKYSERKVTIVTIVRIFLISAALKRLLL